MVDRHTDAARAAREAAAHERLLDAGASTLPRAPWLHRSQPPPAVDLIRFALWRCGTGDAGEDDLLAALTLVPAARAEVDQMEAALLFTARARNLSWPTISRALGLGSAQAAQQRFDRVTTRVETRDGA